MIPVIQANPQPKPLPITASEIRVSPTSRYVIAWEKKLDGPGKGRSTKTFSLDEAVNLANELNQQYPKINHRVEPVER